MTKEENVIGYIYTITNKINDKQYVGQTINPGKRWRQHRNDDIHYDIVLGRVFRKYGVENFEFNIIEECANEQMSERERFWIRELHTCVNDPYCNGYNMTYGGESLYGEENPFYNKTHSEETRKILSEKAKLRTGDSNPFYGRHHSDETKEKISKANTGRSIWSDEQKQQKSENMIGEKNHFFGKKHTEETKRKISEINSGRIPPHAIQWYAYRGEDKGIIYYFYTIGQVMQWLYQNNYISLDEHFTMSILKTRLKDSDTKHIKFAGYYWKKSVETIESPEMYTGSE